MPSPPTTQASPLSQTPPSSVSDSISILSFTVPVPGSIATVSPASSIAPPPPPPPSEVSSRGRWKTYTHRRHSDSIGRRSNVPFGEYLTEIHEESPGSFFEAPTGVPDNTPKTSHAGASVCSSPGSERTNLHPTVINLPQIIQRLEQLPPPAVSRFSSPPSSVTGESSVGEPLMMAAPRRFPPGAAPPKVNPPSPLSTLKESPGGVREHSDWATDIVQDVGRDLARLANLAVDDNMRDPSKSVQSHYRFRLNLLLNDKNQKIMYGNIGDVPLPSTADPSTPVAAVAKGSPSVHVNYVNWSEFKELKDRVDDLNRFVKQLTDMHSHSQKEINALKVEVAVLKKAVGGSGHAPQSGDKNTENDASKIM